ncbi:Xaa-Pro peptidase family protein [Bremerella cremea]|uniref:M24 family metallopeptidase n=1 Tax=Bremerella cremea TaxID=1031537 RepID=UPI0031EEF66F
MTTSRPRSNPRISKLRRKLKQCGADALLVTNFKNVTYLSGFTGDDSYLLVTAKEVILFSDPRFTVQIETECPNLEMDIREPGTSILSRVGKAVARTKIGRLGIESGSMSVQLYQQVRKKLATIEVKPLDGLVEELREIKDKTEIAQIREAVSLAEKAFAVIRAGLRGDKVEKELEAQLTYEIQRNGGRGTSFPPIVGVGERSALPHVAPTMKRIEEGAFVLIDWGADYQMYKSDLTRVLFYGKVPAKMRKMYEVCLQAQLAAIKAIKPGVAISAVDHAARSIIAEAGWGKQFRHGLGHGIGLDIHEAPRLAGSVDRPLEPGMIVTVEPGIYFPGFGGVRIEDDILVTNDGHEVLTSVPKSFDEAHVSI